MISEEQRRALGFKLGELRACLNMSLDAVESATDGSAKAGYVKALECGTVERPMPYVIFALAGVYSYPYEKLMTTAGYLRPIK